MIYISRKGFCPNLTSKMSEESRNKWKQKYINIKRGVVATTLATVTLIDVKAFVIDLCYSKLKRFGYKTASCTCWPVHSMCWCNSLPSG
jgi:uncharacterized protein YnzC (UPF0291/DUF896 family)